MLAPQDQHRNASLGIQAQASRNGKCIPHQTQKSISCDGRSDGSQPLACPDQYVVRQRLQPQQHRLGRKTLLVATSQALLVLLETALDASAARIVEMRIGQQDRSSIAGLGCFWPAKRKDLRRRERREQDTDLLNPLLIEPAQGN